MVVTVLESGSVLDANLQGTSFRWQSEVCRWGVARRRWDALASALHLQLGSWQQQRVQREAEPRACECASERREVWGDVVSKEVRD